MKKLTLLTLAVLLFGAVAVQADGAEATEATVVAQPAPTGQKTFRARVKRFESRAKTLKEKLAKESDADKRATIEAKIKANGDKARKFVQDHKKQIEEKLDKQFEAFKKATPAKQAAIRQRIAKLERRFHDITAHFVRLFPEDKAKIEEAHQKLHEKMHAAMGHACPTCMPHAK